MSKKLTFKTITVDSEKRVAVYVNGVWKDDIDLYSGFSVLDAKQSARTNLIDGYYD